MAPKTALFAIAFVCEHAAGVPTLAELNTALGFKWPGLASVSNMTMDLPTIFPAQSAYSFNSTHAVLDQSYQVIGTQDCGIYYTCPATLQISLTPGHAFDSTFQSAAQPSFTWTGVAGKNYTLLHVDATLGILHWACLNIAGGILSGTNSNCYRVLGVNSVATQPQTLTEAYFPPGSPTTSAATYAFLLFEQSSNWPALSGTGTPLLNYGVHMMTQIAPGPSQFNVTAFSIGQSLTLTAANWYTVKGNAFSAQLMLNMNLASFTGSYNCSLMNETYCVDPTSTTVDGTMSSTDASGDHALTSASTIRPRSCISMVLALFAVAVVGLM